MFYKTLKHHSSILTRVIAKLCQSDTLSVSAKPGIKVQLFNHKLFTDYLPIKLIADLSSASIVDYLNNRFSISS